LINDSIVGIKKFSGFEIGLANHEDDAADTVQIGLINSATRLTGIQISVFENTVEYSTMGAQTL
jgi:hypothetical protein